MPSNKTPDHDKRRQVSDRRQDELGPPRGWRERRRTVERRLPEVDEDSISPGAWDYQFKLFTAFLHNHRPYPFGNTVTEEQETPVIDPANSHKSGQ